MEKEKRKGIEQYLEMISGVSRFKIAACVVAYLMVVGCIVLSYMHPIFTDYYIGDTAVQSVASDYTFSYYDREDLESILQYIQSTQPYHYNYDPEHARRFGEVLSNYLRLFSGTDEQFRDAVVRYDIAFSGSAFEYLLDNRRLVAQQQARLQSVYKKLTEAYIVVDQLPESSVGTTVVLHFPEGNRDVETSKLVVLPVEKELIVNLIRREFPRLEQPMQEALAEILINAIPPAAKIDADQRNRIVEQELANSRLQKVIRQGELIIRRGETIDSDNLAKLLAFYNYRSEHAAVRIVSSIILSLILYLFMIYRFKTYAAELLSKNKNMILVLIAFVLSNAFYFSAYIIRWNFLVPPFLFMLFGINAILLPELLRENKVSVNILLSFSLFYVFYPTFDAITFVNLLVIALLTIYTPSVIKKRQHFFVVGLLIGGLNVAFTLLAYQAGVIDNVMALGPLLGLALANGIVCAMLSMGIMPIAENTFNIPTKLRLIELVSANTSPLLKQLRIEAPGTYNHSMLIGDMAEEAAEIVGEDSLLVKAGSYYHDIGKIESPNFFIENQDGKNRHDKIKPSMSVSVIKAHVKVGVEIAKKYHLPNEVIDYITEHHGTTTISYFYHQAMNLYGDGNVTKEDYAYPGPKPQSKGTAIVMLADNIEATVRAYSQTDDKFGSKIIQDIIDDTIERRMREGQFDECDLTLKDLKDIGESFFKFLSGYYHRRIDYQKPSNK